MLVAVLGIAGVIIVLSTFYGTEDLLVQRTGGAEWTSNLYTSLVDSTIGGFIDQHIVPLLGTLLGPILPPDVREVMA
jgi:hypothetical protein